MRTQVIDIPYREIASRPTHNKRLEMAHLLVCHMLNGVMSNQHLTREVMDSDGTGGMDELIDQALRITDRLIERERRS